MIGFYTTVAHVIPQLQSEVPEALALGTGVTAEALVAAGEKIYNGAGGCTANDRGLLLRVEGPADPAIRCGSQLHKPIAR